MKKLNSIHPQFCARWFTRDECSNDDPKHGRTEARAGCVEIHIGEEVYAGEWAKTEQAAQRWVDDFDFEALEQETRNRGGRLLA